VTNKQLKILLIEDDPKDTVLINEILGQAARKNQTFELESVDRLEKGIKCLSEGGFDAILIEHRLMNGKTRDFCLQLEAEKPNLPVIVLASPTENERALDGLKNSTFDYLFKKGTAPTLFARIIRSAIERSRIRKELDFVTKELQVANSRLQEMSMIDPLTEILNRRGLQQALSRIIQRSQRDKSSVLAILIDLDDFKHINDTLGHAAGDIILKEIAKKLRNSLRATDCVGRIGGDEFMILLPSTRIAEGKHVAERVRLAVAEPISLSSGQEVGLTASLGVAPVTDPLPSVDDLQTRAHPIMLESKHNGKNRVTYGEKKRRKNKKSKHDSSMLEVLAAFREGSCFYAAKQAIVQLSDGKIVGYEFLSRSTVRSFEMPNDFFRLALESNILTLVDHHCFKACTEAAIPFAKKLRCHFNLYPSTMIGIPPEHLISCMPPLEGGHCVEISEQQIIGDPSYLLKTVQKLQGAGILIAIDDVGFGRSCLESLIILEPDIVKIDRKWVDGSSQDPARERSLIRLVKAIRGLGAEAVAEGIEKEEDLELLKSLGVKYGQGYLFGKPVPCSEKVKTT
jgi:diguanylate cyclase (GGDEF)-like protein